MAERVVVTGIGTVNALGLNAAETWERALGGVSGVAPITLFDASDMLVRIACEVKGFDPLQYMPPREARRRDRFEQFAWVAAKEALDQSGLEVRPETARRVAVIVGSSAGGLSSFEGAVTTLLDSGPRRLSPHVIPMFMPNGAGSMIAIEIGAQGPCFSVASACASGADAIGQAWNLLRAGVADAAIAGGTEATVAKTGIAAFDRLGALSRRNEDHHRPPSPFDQNRDGLVMGEGAAILVLETLKHAQARGAEILAELAGYAATADAFHVTAPAQDGHCAAAAIRGALECANINPQQVDYINAHGTGTQLNDATETLAIKIALGDHAYHVPVSSTKSMTGHKMGATAALEAIFCVQAIGSGAVPPTINLHTPDPACDLDYVPNQARELPVRVAVSNAFGFGGHNAVLALRAFSG